MKMKKYYLDDFITKDTAIDDIGGAILDFFFSLDPNETKGFHNPDKSHATVSYNFFLIGLKDNPALDIYFDFFETIVTNNDKVYEELDLDDSHEIVDIKIIPNVNINLNGNSSKSTNSYKTGTCLAVFHDGCFSRIVSKYNVQPRETKEISYDEIEIDNESL